MKVFVITVTVCVCLYGMVKPLAEKLDERRVNVEKQVKNTYASI